MGTSHRWLTVCLLAAGATVFAPSVLRAESVPPADAVRLLAADAAIRGGAQYYAFGDFIGSWNDPGAVIEWDLDVKEAARPAVELTWACAPGCGGDFVLAVGGKRLLGKTESTGDWHTYRTTRLGAVDLGPGPCKVTLEAGPFKGAPMNVKAVVLAPLKAEARPAARREPVQVYVVPNFHPASCGWLTNWSLERNYCCNSYLDHLDRVRDDPEYAFALSEVNNLIAILNFEPERFEELKRRVKEGRVELVNAFFLEPTINLSGGEALVKMGVEGLRWQTQVMGVRPRFAWTIDVCGTHDQMAQITAGLGLEAMVYTRKNPTGRTIHWARSPDGSRTIALSPGHYSEWGAVFSTKEPLTEKRLLELEASLRTKAQVTPAGAPVLVLAGAGDYALAPARQEYPGEFLRQWRAGNPRTEVRFTTLSKYAAAVLPAVRSGRIQAPTMYGGTAYDFDSFWIQNPRVKSLYRRREHELQAAEIIATAASLKGDYAYPVQDLYGAWLLMLLNMDRNTLWGAAGGMVFEHEKSWDVRDRLTHVETVAGRAFAGGLKALAGTGAGDAVVNPLNWRRCEPVGVSTANGRASARVELPAMGMAGIDLAALAGRPEQEVDLPDAIETAHYSARIDPATGALVSLKGKPSGREMLGGPANVLVAERTKKQQGDPGDHTAARDGRERLAVSGQSKPQITARADGLSTTVLVSEGFIGGGSSKRAMRFYKDFPRIDFETHLEDIPDRTVVVAEFPLAEDITEVRRGIPYGFSHGAWSKPNPELHGWTKGITPAVRWSHYTLAGGGGVAILDRGLTGRELTGRTPILFLLNATEKYYGYPNSWLSGKGTHVLEYALVAHDGAWREARIPQMAWEYNCPPIVLRGLAPAAPQSFLQTSDNVIVEALRREGPDIELRMAECFGYAGEAEVALNLPHTDARLTDLVGGNARPLAGGPTYRFPVRPQQIVTMRLRTAAPVEEIKPLLTWDDLVPQAKRAALHTHTKDKGHPPRGN